MTYEPHLIAKYIGHALLLWLFISSISGKNKSVHIPLIFLYIIIIAWSKKIPFEITTQDYMNVYISKREFINSITIFFGIIISVTGNITKYKLKHLSLLGFAVLCHTMILYDLTVTSSALTNFFYEFYDEMIIIVSILQMVVARDGVFTAIGRIQGFVYGFWLRHIHLSKGLCIYSSGKAEK